MFSLYDTLLESVTGGGIDDEFVSLKGNKTQK